MEKEIGMTEKAFASLTDLISSKRACVGVFGAGYVGLPLACAFAEAGFKTLAGDSNREKVRQILNGDCYVEDDYVRTSLPRLVRSRALSAEHDTTRLASVADFAIITVPTPLNERREPDLTFVIEVTQDIAHELRPGKFVILESSVYPGATEEVIKPILEQGGLIAGQDFGLAFSPERIDYGRAEWNIRNTPKVVGGVSPLCTRIAAELYRAAISAQVVPVSSVRAAEATKALENTYRYVNIALVNEVSVLCEKLGIDFFEVVGAAATKPFGFQAFYPGPGVGGHCIPKDPHYLLYRAHQAGLSMRLIETSAQINDQMVNHIIKRLESRLRTRRRSLRGLHVVLLGLAFKGNVSDTRNSPSIVMCERLAELGACVSAYDPLVRQVATRTGPVTSAENLESAARGADIMVLMTSHAVFKEIDLKKLHDDMQLGALVIDTRGFWSRAECESAGFEYLGIGRPD
jgi:UDP-N-acetyl-D-glucosamine dehydrogenase